MASTIKRKISAMERVQAALSAPTRERAHEILSENHMFAAFSGKLDPCMSAIIRLHDSLAISANESSFLLRPYLEEIQVDSSGTDPELESLSDQMSALESSRGVPEGESWPSDPPPAFRALSVRWQQRVDEIVVAHLRALGGGGAADLLERSRAEFNDSKKLGRAEFDQRWAIPRE
jgi:hypothetical protein